MLGQGNTKADKYLKRHDTKKKWLSIMLCVALLTGTVSMYILNKPATAMTEDGAESIGVVMDTANADADTETRAGADADFWEQIPEDELPASVTDTENSENADAENTEDASEVSDASSDEAGVEAADNTEVTDEAAATEGSEGAETSEVAGEDTSDNGDAAQAGASDDAGIGTSDAAQDDSSDAADTSTSDTKVEESEKEASDITDEMPESVDLAEYITETVIERLNEDDEWEVITEDQIKPGNKLRITLKYSIPSELTASEDIRMEIPEQYGDAELQVKEIEDGKGSYEISEDNELIIHYDSEYSKELNKDTDSEGFDNANASFSLSSGLLSMLEGGLLFNFFRSTVITAHASTPDSVSGYATLLTTAPYPKGITIVDVSMQKRADDYSPWTDLDIENGQVNDGERIRFTLDYVLGKGTLTKDNKSVTYNIKERNNITIYESITGGVIEDTSGNVIGSFDVNKDTGIVTITYNDDYVVKNQKDEVESSFFFTALADASASNNNDEVTYNFDDDMTITIKIIKGKEEDFSVKKEAIEKVDDHISYRITVSSPNGSGSAITLTDSMGLYRKDNGQDMSQQIPLDMSNKIRDVVVTKPDGSTERVTPVISDKEMTITLGKLNEGEKYIVEYRYDLPDGIKTSAVDLQINNKATAKNENNVSRDHEIEVYVDGNTPDIKKEGAVDTNKKTVTWTIKLNSEGKQLKGYTLSDNIITKDSNGNEVKTPFKKNVHIEPAIPVKGLFLTYNTNSISLPYKFDFDTTKTYTITYTYDYSNTDLVNGSLKNEASIRLDVNDENTGKTTEGVVGVGQTQLIDKADDGYEKNSNDSQIININWNVTFKKGITCNNDSWLGRYWVYHDELGQKDNGTVNHLITQAQLNALKQEIKNELSITTHIWSKDVVVTGTDKTTINGIEGYKAFTVEIPKDVSKDVTISYQTTGLIGEGNYSIQFKNSAWVFNKDFTDTATQQYSPVVTKFDGNGHSGAHEYEYYSDDLYQQGILTWRIRVSVPQHCKYQTITVTDTLPENVSLIKNGVYNGVQLYGVEVGKDSSFSEVDHFDDGNSSVVHRNINFDKNVDGNKISITFTPPSDKYNHYYWIRVRAKISDDYQWKEKAKQNSFKNSVVAYDEKQTEIGSSSQEQRITKTETVMSKESNTSNLGDDDAIEYTLDINPNASDLLPEGDTLRLTDILTATSTDGAISAALQEEYLHVYEVTEADGTKHERELLSSEYSYSHNSFGMDNAPNDNGSTKGYYYESTITFNIPDGKHLKIVYRYRFTGEQGKYIQVNNKASLDGITVKNSSDETNTQMKIDKARVVARVRTIHLYKTDSKNTSLKLEGAKFDLYEYKDGDWNKIQSDMTTGEEGRIDLEDLTFNHAYKIVETKAPKGYLLTKDPYYFYIYAMDETKYQRSIPADFASKGGVVLEGGDDIYFRNVKDVTSITIKKKWIDESGNEVPEGDDAVRPSSIKVKLSRRTGDYTSSAAESQYGANIVLKNARNKILKHDSYPVLKGGTKLRFTVKAIADEWNVYVPEVTVNGNVLMSRYEGARTAWTDPGTTVSPVGTSGVQDITFEVNVTNDLLVVIKEPNQGGLGTLESSYTESGTRTSDTTSNPNVTEEVGEYEISKYAETSWEKVIDDLPLYYKDEDGNYYPWQYYVSEYKAMYYEVDHYDNNDGITDGTITIFNKRDDTELYALPSTGSTGTLPYTVGGLMLMGSTVLISSILGWLKRRKERELERTWF